VAPNKEMKASKHRKYTFGCRCGYQTDWSIAAEELRSIPSYSF